MGEEQFTVAECLAAYGTGFRTARSQGTGFWWCRTSGRPGHDLGESTGFITCTLYMLYICPSQISKKIYEAKNTNKIACNSTRKNSGIDRKSKLTIFEYPNNFPACQISSMIQNIRRKLGRIFAPTLYNTIPPEYPPSPVGWVSGGEAPPSPPSSSCCQGGARWWFLATKFF